jgi:CDP-diacylglycerol--glycerol-3-phosphate 3-phosphatidyltransferase
MHRTADAAAVDGRLKFEIGVAALAGAGCVSIGYWWLSSTVGRAVAGRWVPPTAVVLAYLVGYLWLSRGAVRTAEGRRLRTLGIANLVTLARAGLLAGVAGFAFVGVGRVAELTAVVGVGRTMGAVPTDLGRTAWLPGLGYGAAVLLDATDGAVARSWGTETRLGTRLDMAVDTTGFLVAPLVAVAWNQLPAYYLSLSMARYAYRGGCALHRRRGGTIGELPPSRLRRPLAALQMAFLAIALVPAAPTPAVYAIAPFILAPSLAVFARDFAAVTRRRPEE